MFKAQFRYVIWKSINYLIKYRVHVNRPWIKFHTCTTGNAVHEQNEYTSLVICFVFLLRHLLVATVASYFYAQCSLNIDTLWTHYCWSSVQYLSVTIMEVHVRQNTVFKQWIILAHVQFSNRTPLPSESSNQQLPIHCHQKATDLSNQYLNVPKAVKVVLVSS